MEKQSPCCMLYIYAYNKYVARYTRLVFLALVISVLAVLLYENYKGMKTFGESKTSSESNLLLLPSVRSDVFQKVNENFSLFFLFNAFDDYRSSSGLLRILTLGDPNARIALHCHINFSNKSVVVPADKHVERILPHMRQMRVEGFFIRCPFSAKERPLSVSVSTTPRAVGANVMRVHHIPRISGRGKQPPGISACVAPLHNLTNTASLAEWIEMNRLLGVSHFTFYNFSLASTTSRLLLYYQRRGLVTVIPWSEQSIPFPVVKKGMWPPHAHKLHYFGQFFTFNDCLYRNLNHHRYLLFIDIDELAVSYVDANLTAYLDRVTGSGSKDISSVVFRNVYFTEMFGEDESLSNSTRKVLTLLKWTGREKRVLPRNVNTKVAVVGDRVLTIHVHETGRRWQGGRPLVAEVSEALLHHYKNSSFVYPHKHPDPGRRERRLLRYANEVASRVTTLLKSL